MNTFIVSIAKIAVTLHLIFGCSWHHGLGGHSACVHGDAPTGCRHLVVENSHASVTGSNQHQHCHHPRKSTAQDPTLEVQPDQANEISVLALKIPVHEHTGCLDDRCSIQRIASFDFCVGYFVVPYLNGSDNIFFGSRPILSGDFSQRFCSQSRITAGLRAHLALGVLIL